MVRNEVSYLPRKAHENLPAGRQEAPLVSAKQNTHLWVFYLAKTPKLCHDIAGEIHNSHTGGTMHPYIGITDFTNSTQVRRMLNLFNRHKPAGSNHKLHVGLMMSYKTLHNIPSRWQDVYTPKAAIAEILSVQETYNCLHYADYKNRTDWSSLSKMLSYGGNFLHAVQLDMIWPDPDMVGAIHFLSSRPVEVILQIGDDAFDQVDNNPQKLVEKLKDYHGVIHRVLLDKSMGRGKSMDAQELLPFARAIKEHLPQLGLGAGGGLGPCTTHLFEPLAKEFHDMSADAEVQLHHNADITNPVDWSLAGNYLVKMLQMFA